MPSRSSDHTLHDSADATRRSDSADKDIHSTLPAPDSVPREGSRSDIQLCWDLLNGNAPNVNVHMGTPVFGVSTGSEEDESTEASEIALQRFVPKQTMGVGAFGVVISVYDQHLQRPAAMKILRPSRGTSSQMIARFLREARTVAPMEHPGIVRVYETV